MSVRIKIPPIFQHETGGVKQLEVNGQTVGECLDELVKRYPSIEKVLFDDPGQLSGWLTVYINGEPLPEDNRLAHRVKDGDEIYPLMLLEGG